MSKNALLKIATEHFKPRSGYERIWLKNEVLPLLEKLDKIYETTRNKNNRA